MLVDVSVPQIGESVTTVFIAGWLKQPGDLVTAGESILEIDSDKASMEVPAPVSGALVEVMVNEGDEVAVGSVVGRIDDSVSVAAGPAEALSAESADARSVKAGPAARQRAGQEGVDLAGVQGTGPKGRVMTEDVAAAANAVAAVSASPARPVVAPDNTARTERVRMSPLRRTIARRLVEAKQTTAMLTTFNEVDMSRIMALRKAYQERFVKKNGIKLGFMSFFVKAVIEGLKTFPAVNAEIDGNEVIYKNYYNIGVAVSAPKGLVVPVLRDADSLSLAGVEHGISALAKSARHGKLLPADFRDGTFTISNGGVFGSLMSTPILNLPQVAILGMHTIQRRPVAIGDNVEIRPMMYLALTYDHRIIDGREAVSFLVRIKECVENPERILLEI